MYNVARDKTLKAPNNDLDEGVLGNVYERQVRQSTLMKNDFTLYQSDMVLKKEPKSYQKWGTVVNDILEHQQQNMLISQKERSRDRAGAVYSLKEGSGQKQRLPLLDVHTLVLKRQKCSFEHDPTKKGKGKGHRSRCPAQRDNSAERQYARNTRKKSIWKRRSSTVFQQQKGIAVMIESVNIGIPRIANISRKIGVKWERTSRSSTYKKNKRSTSPQRKDVVEGKESETKRVTVVIVNIANHRPRKHVQEKLLQFEVSRTPT